MAGAVCRPYRPTTRLPCICSGLRRTNGGDNGPRTLDPLLANREKAGRVPDLVTLRGRTPRFRAADIGEPKMSCRRGLIQRGVQMKAIVVTDEAAGTAGMTLVERPEPPAAINDVVVQVHASGFVPTELSWPSTWTDRRDRDRSPSIPGHELAGVVTALGYGTTGLSVGQRVFGITDWHRDGTLAEYGAVEARNLAPLPGDVDFTVGASLPISGLTAWQGLFEHGR